MPGFHPGTGERIKQMHKIKEVFDEHFQHWQITLPVEDLLSRNRGSIKRNGWTINYLFSGERGKEYIEYFASHRMTNDTLNRIYADGTTELVGFCQEFFLANDKKAEQDYLEHNRKFYAEVEEKGLS